ncbi:MAG TPA: carboxypeptidase-like regulatory domain-containing protein [Pyrinomonadaceae bacterium]
MPHARKTDARLTRKPLCSFAFALLLLVAHSSSAQQPTATPVKPAKGSEAQPAPVKAATVDAPRKGTITGRVVTDDGHPVANAAIFVYAVGANVPPTGDTTDVEGKFQVKELRPAAYSVQANAPGYVASDAGAESGAQRFYHVGESVNLTMVKGGVITGTVTNAEGEAIVGAAVRAFRVRAPSESRAAIFRYSNARMTDDRGVYRLYGLEPGVYVLAVGGSGAQFYGPLNAYDSDAPTYYPSATRDTAAELTVHAGEELNGIDVRYRGERGHTISGFASGNTGDAGLGYNTTTLTLFQGTSSTPESFTFTGSEENNRSFAFDGVPDGDFTLTALRGLGNTGELAVATRKVSVRGADVNGLELKLEPLGALTGTVVLEPPPKANCAVTRASAVTEIVLTARRDEKEKEKENVVPPYLRRLPAAPNDKGEFKLLNLIGGNYRLDVQLPGDDLYVRSIAMPVAAASVAQAGAKTAAQSKQVVPGRFALKNGERINGVTINIAQGAAALHGRVASAAEGVALPARLRLHLVPVEPERATDTLRYMEAAIEKDGLFAFGGIAPGRYWLVARIDAGSESVGAEQRAVASDAGERDKLRALAESAGVKIELQPCQRLADYVLNYGSTPTTQPVVK